MLCIALTSCWPCRQAKAQYEGELKMRSMRNDHVGGIEWLRSILQPQEGNSTVTASLELLAKAQQQVSKKKVMMPITWQLLRPTLSAHSPTFCCY